jgi:hypothetical protein
MFEFGFGFGNVLVIHSVSVEDHIVSSQITKENNK